MIRLSKKRVELIIILVFLLLLSAVWIWYGMELKEIEQKKGVVIFLNQSANML